MTPQPAPTAGPTPGASAPHAGWFSLKAFLLWMAAFAAIFLGLVWWAYAHDGAPAGAPMGEQVGPDEEYETAAIINSAIDTSVESRSRLIESTKNAGSNPPGGSTALPGFSVYTYTRDAHAKGHGCVLASFTVNQHIEPRFAYGVFARPGQTFQAIVRYSNGNPSIQSDSADDPRGMAIKLFDVPGPKLLPGEEKDATQDFIMMNNPVFFIRTLEEYAQFNHLLTAVPPGTMPIVKAYFLQGTPNILRWHLRELKLALGAGKPRPESLVTTRYWSASAYALGPRQYIKFSAIPCSSNKPLAGGLGKSDPDYLRRELTAQSRQGGACFDFAVQPQVIGKNMPVEDTTVEWKESDSPFTPLARIVIQKADNNTAEMYQQCENTAFNPWHSLEDHRPVGVMNRVRKSLYAAMSRFRQEKNCGNPCDPKCNAMKWPDSACAASQAEPQ